MTEPARSFQHYEVLRRDDGTPWELGRGAMGVTYKAFDVNLCCEVALKVVSSALVENPEARERFVREARAAAALRHRNVASVYHLGNDGEHFFYAMEFINGDTLDAVVRRGGALSVENTLRVILQVARALAAAERQHLVHRDIKPANLMVTHEDADEETVVKVIDFGLARAAATAENAPPLTMGGFVGTPQYASPEQLEERPLDARSDIYSLGVTAWFLLTGRAPFAGSLATVCQRQLTQPPPWEQLPPGLPAGVRGLLAHLLEKDATRRPQNAGELRAEIEACLEEIQGTARRPDLHLPALVLAAAPVSPAKAGMRPLQTGTLLNRRYRLLHEAGGRDGVRVFQARDESAADQLVAVKVLPEAMLSAASGPGDLAEEVRLVQAAAHPRLVQILALERSSSPLTTFLVEEWLAGPTVRDLLAARDGVLPVAETLRLLEQAASATDHAARCRLDRLDLGLTALHLTLAGQAASMEDGSQMRALLSRGFSEWPDWTLKIHAFRPHHDPLALDTWAGGATLVPMAGPGNANSSSSHYVQALAALVYELLGGMPTVHHSSGEQPQVRYASLSVLNEEGNVVLQQAMSGGGPLIHGWQLHEALARATGGEPLRGDARFPVNRPSILPKHEATQMPVRTNGVPEAETIGRESTVASLALAGEPALMSSESVAPFFQGRNAASASDPADLVAGSAWDRLSLVTGKRAHPGRWLAGIIGLAAVFVLGFVGVLAWLLQQTPARAAVPTAIVKRKLVEPVAVMTSKRATPRAATPAPLPVSAATAAPPVITERAATAPLENAPLPVSTPPLTNTQPLPAITPVADRLTTVHLDSVPPGAQIRLGDEILGTTPCRVSLPRGDHQLIARYQDWPETRQTIRLDGTEARAAVEIRLMRPDLIPGSVPPQESHARHAPMPAARHALPVEIPAPSARVTPSEPEVRPAQRVLMPFKIDQPPGDLSSPSVSPQPFSVDDADRN